MLLNKISSKYLLLALIMMVLLSCNSDNTPDVSNINADVNIIEFYKEFDAMDSSNVESSLATLNEKYPVFMDAYCQRIVKSGPLDGADYGKRVLAFVDYDANKDIIDSAQHVFVDHKDFSAQLSQAFKYYKYYFPENEVPDIYLMVSGFSQSIAVDMDWVGVSIEKYLGADCIFYEWLEIPKYLRVGMIKEKMAPDVLRAMGLTLYPERNVNDDVISNMIYQGKIKYFVKKMFPKLENTLLFDYSKDQLRWAEKTEKDTWAAIVEWKHLFNDERMTIQKYTGDAPFSAHFGNDSAPRIGEYLGYQIIQSYMKNNPDVSLKELMENNDGRKILAASKYRP
ncbi:gliding motility protein GldB [Saccharicrinis aurantiacus]|uniref:gliding motility lipoprotein GldB n=1 Tax=Saccharicrinis aurantiacus TaxID=1849719 RepID=UPI0024918AB6|nr:gliding motility protein GldB [Saccharicrinis aurantiacus]